MLGAFLASRRRLVARNGRPMTCQRLSSPRPATYASTKFTGVFAAYSPEQISQGLQQGDAHITAMAEDFAAWGLGPPKAADRILMGGPAWIVQGVMPIYEGDSLIGHMLHIRGGATS